eukprot:jgi/Psemu1/204873/e_gw1.359.34.1
MGWSSSSSSSDDDATATTTAIATAANANNKNENEWPSLIYVLPSLKISSDPSLVSHGRGLVATEDIPAGSLLFVHPPTVRADVSQIMRIYQNKARSNSSSNNLLESIAETVLLKEMKRAIRGRTKQTANARIAASFLALNGDHSDVDVDPKQGTAESGEDDGDRKLLDDNQFLLGIIRHNAFGPDFHHYHRMERELQANNTDASSNSISISPDAMYARVLGHYPLAAMINHSCGPTNATRVFYGEVMVATATMDISSGSELVWPYCPPILPLAERSERLRNGYGFSCGCHRCASEARVGNKNYDDAVAVKAMLHSSSSSQEPMGMAIAKATQQQQQEQQDDLLQESLRLGYTQLYIRYFNQALQQQESRAKILKEATELHFAFARTHNACTEHLSLLHLCYELSVLEGSKEAVRSWTERLREAHLCRYSNEIVGKNLETLRTVLKHTRTVLRTEGGWKTNGFCRASGRNSFL